MTRAHKKIYHEGSSEDVSAKSMGSAAALEVRSPAAIPTLMFTNTLRS